MGNGGPQTTAPTPLLHVLGAIGEWLDAGAVPGAIVGGVAASILGRPRFTEDIDVLALVETEGWPAFLARGRRLGFIPRDALGFAKESRVLLVTHRPTGMPVEVVFGELALEEEIVRGAVRTEIAGVAIPLPTAESIVVMKALARRLRDLADIEGIFETCDNLDLSWIRARLTEFDQALGRADLLDGFDRLVARMRRQEDFGGPAG